MFWVLLGLFLLQPTSSCAGLTEAAIWLSLSRSEQQGQMCLRLVLCRRPWPGWHSSSRDACPASSFPLRHIPFPLSSSPLCLGMLCSAMGGCSVNCPWGTDPGEKESIRIKPKETIFSAISFSVGSTAWVERRNQPGDSLVHPALLPKKAPHDPQPLSREATAWTQAVSSCLR